MQIDKIYGKTQMLNLLLMFQKQGVGKANVRYSHVFCMQHHQEGAHKPP